MCRNVFLRVAPHTSHDQNCAKKKARPNCNRSQLTAGERVASFGDGPGLYKKRLLELDQVALCDAFDGAPHAEATTEGRCQFLDLSVPVYHLEDTYDWIVSSEVAEHIPRQSERHFLDNLARYGREGIILSWAKLGQGGHSHVNNQDLSYVVLKMQASGWTRSGPGRSKTTRTSIGLRIISMCITECRKGTFYFGISFKVFCIEIKFKVKNFS